jgi:aminoglycoside phosphotransferase
LTTKVRLAHPTLDFKYPLHPSVEALLDAAIASPFTPDADAVRLEPVIREDSHPLLKKIALLVPSCRVLFRSEWEVVIQIAPTIVLKAWLLHDQRDVGSVHRLMAFIRERAPSIPLPDPLGVLQSGKSVYELQSFLPGHSLESAWSSLSDVQRRTIQSQLSAHLKVLRAIPHETGMYGDLDGGVWDDRLRTTLNTAPIHNREEWLDHLLRGKSNRSPARASYVEWLRSVYPPCDALVLTHADLQAKNILVEVVGEEARLTGIVDWEQSGFYPAHWEYSMMHRKLGTETKSGVELTYWKYAPTDAIGECGGELFIERGICVAI